MRIRPSNAASLKNHYNLSRELVNTDMETSFELHFGVSASVVTHY